MIITQSDQDKMTITLMPNRSLSLAQTRMVIYGVSAFLAIIAIGWSLAGAYWVLPFAGLDVILFGYFMHKVCYATYEKQIITIDNTQIKIQSGRHSFQQTTTFVRPTTYLVVMQPEQPSVPIKLDLADAESRLELGSFLTQHDKTEVRQTLKKVGLREVDEQWWMPAK